MLVDEERAMHQAKVAHRMAQELQNLKNNMSTAISDVDQSYADEKSTAGVSQVTREPLITKAYDAFRKNKAVTKTLVPTEAYIEDQYKQVLIERERATSGTSRAQHIRNSTHVQTAGMEDGLQESTSLPNIRDSMQGSLQNSIPQSSHDGNKRININSQMSHGGPENGQFSRLSLEQPKSAGGHKQATVVNMNSDIRLPSLTQRKKNKNDFYRFLLSNNRAGPGGEMKINNDVFIPRSILKRHNCPGSIKEQRLEAAAEEFFEYQL
jgi:hypothetical protein